MGNVICPIFGARSKPNEAAPAVASVTKLRPVRYFGHAAGYDVAIVRDENTKQGPVFKVIAGLEDGSSVEVIAILPDKPESEAHAERVGMAILRTLEVVEAAGRR